ncbi:hypothetical protein HMPREF3159_15930 [Brachybacterium sp. HMSC06H03]|uniref:polysaccharide pyruvyl transferase family protein n=1 Tax=Brachybacterium sp. HMSC06H03 TaxID=1581127 RepID=UPI0008A458B3|nr:polysaccharide pyruvyl transferase family protein [Brachybacterium sp. HMSC06H03]OFT44127.1 hypothetical protein HMPREF3159_15930 [Brachybacterium sp. HMSC06H03]
MKTIAVVGYFGWGNFGDQLFLDTVRRRREELWPGSSEILALTTRDLGRHATTGPLGALVRAAHSLRILRRADVLAYCGGSVFTDVSGVDALRRRLRPDRVQALGVSVGPFADEQARQDVKQYLGEFERIVVRDDSWTLLQEDLPLLPEPVDGPPAGIEQGGDLAALSPLITRAADDERSGLVVCPSAAADADVDLLAEQVLQARRAMRLRGLPAPVRLLALNGHPRNGDEQLVRALAAALRDQGVECTTSSFLEIGLERTAAMLGSASLVLSQRLHGAIVAYLSGGRFLMLDHHAKCRAFVEDISGDAAVCVPVHAPDLSEALEAALCPERAPLREPEEYIRHAERVYLGQMAHA